MLINIEGYYDIELTDSVKQLLSKEILSNLATLFEANAPFVICLNYFTSLNLEEKILQASNYALDNFNFLLQYYIMAQKIIAKTKYNENLELQKNLLHLKETVDDTRVHEFVHMKLCKVNQEIELAEVEKEYGKETDCDNKVEVEETDHDEQVNMQKQTMTTR